MDTDDLQVFCRVAQLGSLAAAARADGSEASTVSRKITSLEAQLGTRLFQRTTRSLALTEAGSIFLSRIEPILTDLNAAKHATVAAIEQPFGALRITASNAYGEAVLAPLLTSFCQRYSLIDIDLLLTDAMVDLVTQQVDVAIRLGPRPTGDLIISKLKSTERRLVASPRYIALEPLIERPQDLSNCVCLVTSNSPQPPLWFLQCDAERVEMPVSPRIRTSNTLALRQCVLDGLGISLLPDWLVDDDIQKGRLVRILPEWRVSVGADEAAVWAAYPSRSYLPAKTRAFVDYIRTQLSK